MDYLSDIIFHSQLKFGWCILFRGGKSSALSEGYTEPRFLGGFVVVEEQGRKKDLLVGVQRAKATVCTQGDLERYDLRGRDGVCISGV